MLTVCATMALSGEALDSIEPYSPVLAALLELHGEKDDR